MLKDENTVPAQKQLGINRTRPEPSFFGTNRDWQGTRPCSRNTSSTLSASQRKSYSREKAKHAKLHNFSRRQGTGRKCFSGSLGEQVQSMRTNYRCSLRRPQSVNRLLQRAGLRYFNLTSRETSGFLCVCGYNNDVKQQIQSLFAPPKTFPK